MYLYYSVEPKEQFHLSLWTCQDEKGMIKRTTKSTRDPTIMAGRVMPQLYKLYLSANLWTRFFITVFYQFWLIWRLNMTRVHDLVIHSIEYFLDSAVNTQLCRVCNSADSADSASDAYTRHHCVASGLYSTMLHWVSRSQANYYMTTYIPMFLW